MKVIGVIPARFGSTRLPGKPLKDILGKPMIQWVYERATAASLLDSIVVATDNEEVLRAVKGFGGDAVMTATSHPNGTSRIAEVAEQVSCDIVVNIQGDEPMLEPEQLNTVVRSLVDHPTSHVATLCVSIQEDAYNDPSVVKVVLGIHGQALYFSRSLIPFERNTRALPVYEHLGVYAYRRPFLLEYAQMSPTPLEQTESLEQLRVLEHGYEITVAVVESENEMVSVDTEADLQRVVELMRKDKK